MHRVLDVMQKKAQTLNHSELGVLCKGILDDIERCETVINAPQAVIDLARDAVEKQKRVFEIIQTGMSSRPESPQSASATGDEWKELSQGLDVLQDAFYPFLQQIENRMA